MATIQAAETLDPTWPDTWPRTADEIHVFDLQGDVLLKLVRQPEADEESDIPSAYDEDRPQVEEVFDEEPDTGVEVPDAKAAPDEETAPAVQEPDEDANPDDESAHSDASSISSEGLTDVHMRVSSKHLMLASPVFRSMLGLSFEEGQRLRAEGSTEIALGDDDPDAFEILMNIVHGLTRKVPRSVTLDMLTKLAVLVNYYQMHEAVELFSDTWIDDLINEGFPDSYSPEAIRWLLITWVFHKPVEFRAISRIIELGCDETLDDELDEGFPIPGNIIAVMLAHRAAAIEGSLLIVHGLIARYSGPDVLCPVVWDEHNKLACDSFILGSLIKNSSTIGIWPKPNAPYEGIVFKDLTAKLRDLKVFNVCNHNWGRYQSCSDAHGVKESIEASMSALEDAMCGLNLEDFLPEQAFAVQ